MSSEYFYTKTKFTERLALLSSQKGIEFKEMKNLPRILARRIVESGVIPVHEFEDKGYVLENTRQKIARDINNGYPLKVEFLDWYCRYFNCSADYLMGYIDTPTHEVKEVQELTGLNHGAVETLLCKHPEVINTLNDLLEDIESPGSNDPDHIAATKRSLLYDLHVYFTDPGRITGIFSGFSDSIQADGSIFVQGSGDHLGGFEPSKLPSILMLSIQESLQNIRNHFQKNK